MTDRLPTKLPWRERWAADWPAYAAAIGFLAFWIVLLWWAGWFAA